jgi:peptidoglycan L-alanyl-D-glutamate endopeptidase CwlK
MAYKLGTRSEENLRGVHEALQRIVRRAIQITKQDFTVIEGLRTRERQAQLVKDGFSRTMNSKHLTGRAVDIVPFPVSANWNNYKAQQWKDIADAMKAAAKEQGVRLVWGGDWRSFVDKPHYEI